MNTLWPFVVLTLAPFPFLAYLVWRRQWGRLGLLIIMPTLAFYYAQGPNDIDFIKTWGRPLAMVLYISIFTASVAAYIVERRMSKHGN